jgi:hypothetical protein
MTHPRRAARLLAALSVSAAAAGCSPVHDWREVRVGEGALVVLFPCKPERLTRTVDLADAPAAVELTSCGAGGTTWSATSADVGDPGRVAAALTALHDARLKALAGREVGRAAYVPAGATPHVQSLRFEVEGQRPGGEPVREVSLVFAKGNRVFHLGALGADPPPQALETWVESLQLAR